MFDKNTDTELTEGEITRRAIDTAVEFSRYEIKHQLETTLLKRIETARGSAKEMAQDILIDVYKIFKDS